jgi:hypothetical protein
MVIYQVNRDSTAIPAREKVIKKEEEKEVKRRKSWEDRPKTAQKSPKNQRS